MDMKEANGDHNKAISLVQQILVAAPQFSACYEYLLNYGSNVIPISLSFSPYQFQLTLHDYFPPPGRNQIHIG